MLASRPLKDRLMAFTSKTTMVYFVCMYLPGEIVREWRKKLTILIIYLSASRHNDSEGDPEVKYDINEASFSWAFTIPVAPGDVAAAGSEINIGDLVVGMGCHNSLCRQYEPHSCGLDNLYCQQIASGILTALFNVSLYSAIRLTLSSNLIYLCN